jgi:hypothetical protein
MARPIKWLLGAGLAFSVLAGAAARAEAPVTLAPEQMRAAAVATLKSGQPHKALSYSNALLNRDPNDRIAHLIRARAARDLGEIEGARTSAKAAWELSETPDQKYSSAMVMAQVLATAGQRTRAQWWLRRAVQAAPNTALSQKAVRDFKYVRARNPWATRLSFSVTPDSNINNGSSERSSFLNYNLTEQLYGQQVEHELGGTALALSGLEYALGFDTRYRLYQTSTRAHDLTFSLDARHYTLSGDAKQIAPTAEGSDFAFVSYAFGYGHRGINMDEKGEYTFGLDLGQTWYGGEEYTRFIRGRAGQSYALSPEMQVHMQVSGERQFGEKTSDLDTLRSAFSVTQRLENGSQLRLTASGAVTSSPTQDQEFTELGVRAQMSLGKPVFGAHVTFGLGVRGRDYDTSIHSRDGRQDTRATAEVTLAFPKIDYYGFNPTMTLSASQTNSNIGLFQSDRVGINFGIQSAF